jgi:hypothetical protein
VDVPTPTEHPEMDSCGLVFRLRANDIYWFENPRQMIAFLYLGGTRYLSGCTWERKHSVSSRLLAAWSQASADIGKDLLYLEHHVGRAEKLLKGDADILWWGKFRDLIEGEDQFPQEIRDLFWRCTGDARPKPPPPRSKYKSNMTDEEEKDWIKGIVQEKPGQEDAEFLYKVKVTSYIERFEEWLRELDG